MSFFQPFRFFHLVSVLIGIAGGQLAVWARNFQKSPPCHAAAAGGNCHEGNQQTRVNNTETVHMLLNSHRIFQYIVCLSVFGVLAAQVLAQTNHQPTILVDSIPSDAVIINNADIKLPPEELKGKSNAEIEQMLADRISSDLRPFARQKGASFLCLLPAKGEDMRAFSISGSDTN